MGNCFLLTLGSHRPEGICPRPFGRSAGLAPRGDQGGHEHHADADADQQADQKLPHRADSLGVLLGGRPRPALRPGCAGTYSCARSSPAASKTNRGGAGSEPPPARVVLLRLPLTREPWSLRPVSPVSTSGRGDR
jgi:hypothetical protein